MRLREPLPIIFFHKGNPEFLKYSLWQAKLSNWTSNVILLGDDSNKWLGEDNGELLKNPRIDWYDYKDYKERAQVDLVRNYVHMSTNPAEYELICIARWFIIYDFMMLHNMDKAFVTDSDVLLFCDVGEEREKHFKNYRCTLTNNTSAGISFINDVTVLGQYCNFVLDCYTSRDKFHFDKAKTHYECLRRANRPGGVADLTWWGLMKQLSPGEFGETTFVTNEFTTFDHCLRSLHGYESDGQFKKIHFKRKKQYNNDIVPFCKHLRLKTFIKFNCLHMQGVDCKPLIKKYFLKCHDGWE